MELIPASGQRSAVLSIAFGKDGTRLLTVGRNLTARLWEVATGKEIAVVAANGPAVAYPDGTAFVVPAQIDREQVLCVLDAATGKEQRRIEMPGGKVLHAAFAPNGTLLATGHEDGRIRIWEFVTGRLVRALQLPGGGKSSDALAWSPDGRVLASTRIEHDPDQRLFDPRIRLWNPLTGKRLRVLSGHRQSVKMLSFSPDGKLLASSSCGESDTIRIREVASGEEVVRLPVPVGNPIPIAFSPDGTLLVSGNNDNTKPAELVRVWETPGWKELARLPVGRGGVLCLAFSPDGTRLAIGKNDGSIPIWDVTALRALAAPRPQKLGAAELKDLWGTLTHRDPAMGQLAVQKLASGGADSVAFLAGSVQPAQATDPKWIAEQLEKLDSDDGKTREAAFTALENIADEAEAALREAAERPTNTVDLRKRLDELLAIPGPIKSPEALRRVRTVQVLERIGSDAARELLRKLGEGNPKAPETLDARSALDRLNSRDRRK